MHININYKMVPKNQLPQVKAIDTMAIKIISSEKLRMIFQQNAILKTLTLSIQKQIPMSQTSAEMSNNILRKDFILLWQK